MDAQLGFKRKILSGREVMNIWKPWADIINRIKDIRTRKILIS